MKELNNSIENLNISDVRGSEKFNNYLTAENIYNFLFSKVKEQESKVYNKYIKDDEDIARDLLNDLSLEIDEYIDRLKLDKYK